MFMLHFPSPPMPYIRNSNVVLKSHWWFNWTTRWRGALRRSSKVRSVRGFDNDGGGGADGTSSTMWRAQTSGSSRDLVRCLPLRRSHVPESMLVLYTIEGSTSMLRWWQSTISFDISGWSRWCLPQVGTLCVCCLWLVHLSPPTAEPKQDRDHLVWLQLQSWLSDRHRLHLSWSGHHSSYWLRPRPRRSARQFTFHASAHREGRIAVCATVAARRVYFVLIILR